MTASPLAPKLVLFLCIFLILFLREPKCLTQPGLFAEDATDFFHEELVTGPAAVFTTLAQYLHLVPRLLALGSSALPIASIPFAYAFEALAVASACCWAFCLNAFRPLLRSDALRFTLCLIAATALPSQEIVGTLANLQWYLTMLAIPLSLLAAEPARIAWRILLFVLALSIALSGPLTLVLLPVIAFYGLRRHRLTFFQMGLTIGTIIQWTVLAFHWKTQPGGPLDFAAFSKDVFAILVAFTNQIAMFSMFGRPAIKAVYGHGYNGASLLLYSVLLFLLFEIAARSRRAFREKLSVMLFIIVSALILAVGRGMQPVYTTMSSSQPWGAHRYFLAACWCFAFIALLSVENFKPLWPAYKQCALAAALFALGAWGNFRLAPHPASNWKTYAADIQDWTAARKTGREHDAVIVPVNPPGWTIQLPALVRRIPATKLRKRT